MGAFRYGAYDAQGNKTQGRIEATDPDHARKKIQSSGLIPVEINPEPSRSQVSLSYWSYRLFRRPPLREMEYFLSELSLLLNNQIRLNRALEMVSRNIEHPGLREVVGSLHERIRKGDSLFTAMQPHPRFFDRMMLNLVQIGEYTGKLGEILQEIVNLVKFRARIRKTVVQSLTYPAFILIVCLLSLLFVFNFVVPRFATLFSEMKNMPVYTAILLNVSAFVTHYQWYLVPGLVLLGIFLMLTAGRGDFSRMRDRMMVALPVIRLLTEKTEQLRFANGMYILLRNRIQLDRALQLAVNSVNNRLLRQRLLPVVKEVKGGAPCAQALNGAGMFPPFFLNLVEVGETTGNMAEVFGEIVGELENKFQDTVQRLVTLIEPLAIILMAVLVGAIIVVIMLSIVSVYDIQY